MERKQSGITRRQFMSAIGLTGAATTLGFFLGRGQGSTDNTTEQSQYERVLGIQAEMKDLHKTDVYLEMYPRDDKSIAAFHERAFRVMQEKGNVSYEVDDQEMFFARSRFITQDGSEVKQHPTTIFPNTYSEAVMNQIVKNVPAGNWSISDFESYGSYNKSNYDELYGPEEGNINTLIPLANLPEKHFLFAFSHKTGTDMWFQEPLSAFDVTLEGEKSIFVSLNTHNPDSTPANLTFTQPTHDKLVFFITDINGKVIEMQSKNQLHWASNF